MRFTAVPVFIFNLFSILIATHTTSLAHAKKDTLVGAFDLPPSGHQEAQPYAQAAGNWWLSKVYSPLVSYNSQLTGLAPKLAQSWSNSADFKVWRFVMRSGACWDDGKPVTAADVLFTFQLVANPEFGWHADPGVLENLVDIKADGTTVQFSLKKPDAHFPYKLVSAYILPKHVLEKEKASELKSKNWFLNHGVGSGPWKISMRLSGREQTLVPNPYYWAGQPHLKRLVNLYFQNEVEALKAFKDGEVHLLTGEYETALAGLNAGSRVLTTPSNVTVVMSFNLRAAGLDSIDVRNALASLFHLSHFFTGGDLRAMDMMSVSVLYPQYGPRMKPAMSFKEAKEVLRLKLNRPVNIVTYYTSEAHRRVLDRLTLALNEVGVIASVQYLSTDAFRQTTRKGGTHWDMVYLGIGTNDGASIRHALLPSKDTVDGKSWGGVVDPLLENGIAKVEQTPVGTQDYSSAVRNLCQYLLSKNYEIPLLTTARHLIVSDRLENFHWYAAPGGGPFEDHSEKWRFRE